MEYIQERFGRGVDEINILLLGDTHTGHPNYREYIVDDALEEIKSRPNGRIFLMGDLTEIALTTTYGSTYEQTLTPEEQVDYWVAKLDPFREFIVGAVAGNHNQRIVRAVGMNPLRLIFKILQMPEKFLGYSAVVKWAFNKGCFHSRHWHGSTTSKRPGYILRKIKEMRENVEVEVACMGHTHRLLSRETDIRRIPDPRNMVLNHRRYFDVNTGSALGWPDGYAEMKDYDEVMLGFPIIKACGKEGNLEIEIDKLSYVEEM